MTSLETETKFLLTEGTQTVFNISNRWSQYNFNLNVPLSPTYILMALPTKTLTSSLFGVSLTYEPCIDLIIWMEEPMSIHQEFERTYVRLDSKQTKAKGIR